MNAQRSVIESAVLGVMLHANQIVRLLPFLLLRLLATAVVRAQQPSPTVPPPLILTDEEDPTKPLFFSLRNEYRNLKSDAWADTAILRLDRLSLRRLRNEGGGSGLLLRTDVPFNVVHTATVTKFGLGNIYGQALYLPFLRRKLALAVGSGIVLPTATNKLLGQGKLILAPTVIPVGISRDASGLLLSECRTISRLRARATGQVSITLSPTPRWPIALTASGG